MNIDDAKKVLEMLSEGKDEIPKKTVFEIMDMIRNEPSTVYIPWTYPITPNIEQPHITWNEVTCSNGRGTK